MAAKHNVPPVTRYHDRVAGIYDTIYSGNPYWEVVFEITWRHIKKFLPRDLSTRCLDVGCGTGRWGLKLLKSGYATDFLDISHKMLDQVGKKLVQIDPTPMPDLYQVSLDDMQIIEAGRYDFIVGQGDPLNSCDRPEKALKELARVMAPGGILLMSVDNRYAGGRHYLEQGDVAGLKRFMRDGRTTWVTDKAEEQYPLVMFTPEGIRKMCAKRGFELLSLIGKTVLPLRQYKALLAMPAKRDELIRLEESLNRTEALLGNAAHLEFVVRKKMN